MVDACPNCGHTNVGRFCSQCGQRQTEGLPLFKDLLQETLGALFSYDGKLWHSLGVLLTRPGQLTVDFVQCRRARYLGPIQMFLWLQAITFVVHQAMFDNRANVTHNKSFAIFGIGVIMAMALWISDFRRRGSLTLALVATAHVWSFLMVVLLIEYAIAVPLSSLLVNHGYLSNHFPLGQFVTLVAVTVVLAHLVIAIHQIYDQSWSRVVFRTLWLVVVAVISIFGLESFL